MSLVALAVNRFSVKTPENLPLSAAVDQAESMARMGTGGEGGTPRQIINLLI